MRACRNWKLPRQHWKQAGWWFLVGCGASVSLGPVNSARVDALRAELARGAQVAAESGSVGKNMLCQCEGACCSSHDRKTAAGDVWARRIAATEKEFERVRDDKMRCETALRGAHASEERLKAAAVECSARGAKDDEATELRNSLVECRVQLGETQEQNRAQVAALQALPRPDRDLDNLDDLDDCPQTILRRYPRAAPQRPLQPGVTLATHMDQQRVGLFARELEARWKGPIALAIFADSTAGATHADKLLTNSAANRQKRLTWSVFMVSQTRRI